MENSSLKILALQMASFAGCLVKELKNDLNNIILTDTGEDSKLVHRRKCPKVDASIFFFFFRRVLATSMTQRRVEISRVHFWTLSPVSVKTFLSDIVNGSKPF